MLSSHLSLFRGDRPNSSVEIEIFPFHRPNFTWTLKNMRRQLERSVGRSVAGIAIYRAQKVTEDCRLNYGWVMPNLRRGERTPQWRSGIVVGATGGDRVATQAERSRAPSCGMGSARLAGNGLFRRRWPRMGDGADPYGRTGKDVNAIRLFQEKGRICSALMHSTLYRVNPAILQF